MWLNLYGRQAVRLKLKKGLKMPTNMSTTVIKPENDFKGLLLLFLHFMSNLHNSFIHFQVETTEIAKQQRATIMEQKLQAIKQQGIPKKRSLLKTPSKTSLHAGTCSSVTQKR